MANTAIDLHNTISTELAYEIIKTNVKTIMDNPALSKAIPPMMVRGAPGIGKSSIVKKVANDLGINYIDIRLSQMEPVDLRGLPVPDKEHKIVEWFVSGDLPREEKHGKFGILLFDELTSADRSLQVASYELILDRRLGNLYKIPDGWYIVACGNRVEDRAVSTTMSSALANRFMHFDMEANYEDWKIWAIKNGLHPSVIGFIDYRPSCLFEMKGQNLERGWPSPRSWERVSNMISLYGSNEDVFRKIVYGLVGNKVGVEFMEFHKINKNFNSVLDMMTNPNSNIVIPTRMDEKYAFCSAVQYLVWRGTDDDDRNNRLIGLFRICEKLESDFATMTMFAALQGNNVVSKAEAGKFIFKHPHYTSFMKKHGAALRKKYSI